MQNEEQEANDVNIEVNFRNGGFAEFKKTMGYQIQSGVLFVLTQENASTIYPLDTIQNISITQE